MTPTALVVVALGSAAVGCWSRARSVSSRVVLTRSVGDVGRGADPSGPPGSGSSALRPGRVGSMWAQALADAGIDGDPRRWARVAVGGSGLVWSVGAVRGGAGGAVVVGALAVAAGLVALRVSSGRGVRRADARLPDLLEHAGRSLRGGVDLVPALRAAADAVGGLHGAEVVAAVARVDGGAPLSAALAPWRRAHPRPPVELAVGALEVAAVAGGARGRALDGVAATLRARTAVAEEARALSSQAAASAAVLVAMPLVVTVLGALADPRVAGDLLGTPVGLACLVVAVVLDGIGALWMHRIVRAER